MKKSLLMFLLAVCMLLVGCGKKVETKEYIIPGTVMFSPDDDDETKTMIIERMKYHKAGEEKVMEDAYIDENGDVVVVMTEKQRRKGLKDFDVAFPQIMFITENGFLGYGVNEDKTLLKMVFESEEVSQEEINQATIDNALDMLFTYQIYAGVLAEDAEVTLVLNYDDTGEDVIKVYKCEDMPFAE